MNTLPPNEPLDEQERELARILHALPGGDPPPALDAKILRAAANAAASSNRPVRRALASAGALWGIGSAAAAVLALGVAWQLRYGVHDEAALRERAPSAHVVSDTTEDDSVQVEIPAQAENAPMAPPPMAAAKPAESADTRELRQAPARAAAPAAPAPAPAPAAAAPAAEPEPFAADQAAAAAAASNQVQAEQAAKMQDEERARAAAAEGARTKGSMELKERDELAAKSEAYANAAPPPPPPPPGAAYRPAAVGGGFVAAQSPPKATQAAPAQAQARADTGTLASASAASGAVAKTEQAPRKPETWLADIRKLREQGKIEEARASLVEFRKKYPKWVIPTDLAPLQSE